MIKVNDVVIENKKFPDGTSAVKIPDGLNENLRNNPDKINVDWHYENDAELVMLIYVVNYLKEHGYQNIDLFMPYIPNARQDRVKKENDVFTLKYFSKIINDLQFDCVTVLDPHSYVSEALIDRLIVLTPQNIINDLIANQLSQENVALFYPDEGAMKRYSGMIDRPYAFGIKNRDWVTGEIKGLDVAGQTDCIKGRNILIVDDICSRGGTFYYSAKKLKELGAENIYLFVSHCETTILEGELLTTDLIKTVYTTNSICSVEHEKVEVIKL